MEAIRINNLTKNYGKVRGIDKISLTVNRGDFFGFIGPNGAGKSTTIRTLLGLINPSGGDAEVLGLHIVKDREKILERVGYLPSEAVFYHGMRVRDILKLSADLRRKDCSKMGALLCERLQLDMSRKAEDLSFGNRKKVAIVCAMQHDPELLILDEPTGGLDPLMQKEFFEILQERNREGKTIFLSSHILSEIQRYCTHAAIIREGKIIACDSVKALSGTEAKQVSFREEAEAGAHAAEVSSIETGAGSLAADVSSIETEAGAHAADVGSIAAEVSSIAAEVGALAGVRNLQVSGKVCEFLYSGKMGDLLKVLAKGNVCDLTISEPDLEEVFMHYYEEGGTAR